MKKAPTEAQKVLIQAYRLMKQKEVLQAGIGQGVGFNNGDIWRLYSQALLMIGKNRDAVSVAKESVNLEPENSKSWRALATAQGVAGDVDDAVVEWKVCGITAEARLEFVAEYGIC